MLTVIEASACCELLQFGFRQADNAYVVSIIPCSEKRGVVHPDSK